ncbi:hypothetical protein [Isoalcanivorax indicus]|uniref:hypothetical protein n=1 Tax=Isoalcanivorax indicus TaxID=2202653 RepID=UPI0013C4D38F|nr:hypothetical protein [Isoalcanivorax indicus]
MTDNEQNYYAPTAYNSEKPRNLPPARDRSEDGYFLNKSLGNPINLPKKSHCREYLAQRTPGSWYKLSKNPGLWSESPSQEDGPHVKVIWGSIFEWPVFIRMLNHIFGIFIFVGGAASVALYLFIGGLRGAMVMIEFLLIPTLAWATIRYLTRKEPKLKTDTRFFRRTGMVSIYLDKGKRQEIPFDEFDPYVSFNTGPSGSSSLILNLVHRYSNTAIGYHNAFMFEDKLKIEWEQLCDFMDISRPLPETPIYEQCRHWDPVSKAYDEKHNRPSDYWHKMSKKDIQALTFHAYDAVKDYPWGRTRQQALAQGWKPSEQRWQEEQAEKKRKEADQSA